MTPLDAAHAAMAAAPDDDGARLRFWGALAEARLLLLLAEEASGDRIVPAEAEVEGGRFVMAFDTEDRLAGFAGIAVPHAVLSGRALAGLLAGQGIGLALNPDVAPSAILCPAEVIDWLAVAIPGVPEAIESCIAELLPPWRLPETVVAAIGRRLGLAGGLAEAAWLAEARHADGESRHVLAVVGAVPGAEPVLAAALAEALGFCGVGAGEVDVTFLAADAPVLAQFGRVGLRFDLPGRAGVQDAGPAVPDLDLPPRLR